MSDLGDLVRQLPTPDHGQEFWENLDAVLEETAPAPRASSRHAAGRLRDVALDLDVGAGPSETGASFHRFDRRRVRRRLVAAAATAAVLTAIVVGYHAITEDSAPIDVITDHTTTSRPDPDLGSRGERPVLSPLVQMSDSLLTQSDTELFSVRVDPSHQDYWRTMALTRFEDGLWRRSSDFDEALGPVDSDIDATVPTRSVRQEITVRGLGNIYLPAAYEVSEIVDSGGIDLEYEVATGALVVARGLDDIPSGLTYTIESQVPDYSPDDLPADATEGLSGGFVEEHTQLPNPCGEGESTVDTGCWPTEVSDRAAEIVEGATTDHERVLALQSFFLDPARFTYDLEVALEHDINSMNEFLVVGRGHGEQFASTFAAMARSLGIPARVAVGFTWGDWDEQRQEFVVRGRNAHAWPEVYFSGVGWVIFDPTPGRSRGLDADITRIDAPQQAGAQDIPGPPPQAAGPP